MTDIAFGSGGYDPSGGGLKLGGGSYRSYFAKRKKGCKHFPNVALSDPWAIRNWVPDFDPSVDYTERELLLIAEKILINDPKPPAEHPTWLPAKQLLDRAKREIYCKEGTPDPAIVSGLYWRTHPNGRTVNSLKVRREQAASYYR